MRGMSRLALEGLRVIAVEQFGAGPWATLQLADLGAEVIKIEDRSKGGDVGRYIPPAQDGQDSVYFEAFNRGKRSVALDLRDEQDREDFQALVKTAEIVFCNLRGDVVDKLKLTYEHLSHVNPRIVCCSLSGFGLTGPRRAQGAYDATIQALAGWQSLTGGPQCPPTKTGLSVVDFCGGLAAAVAMLAATLQARVTGVGCDIDMSLFEVALAQLNYVATWQASRGIEPVRRDRSAHPSIVPFQNFRTQDGWITIACAKEELWRKMCSAIGRADWVEDPRFIDFAARWEHRDVLADAIEAHLATGPTATWVAALETAGVPCSPLNDVGHALQDPQAVSRRVIQEVEHPLLGTVRHVSSPLRLSTGRANVRLAPRLGEDTEAVLASLPRKSDLEPKRN